VDFIKIQVTFKRQNHNKFYHIKFDRMRTVLYKARRVKSTVQNAVVFSSNTFANHSSYDALYLVCLHLRNVLDNFMDYGQQFTNVRRKMS